MKLLRVLRSLNPASGGPAEGVCQITPHLTALGVQTTVISFDPPESHWLTDHAFRVVCLGPVHGTYGYRRGLVMHIRELAMQHDCVIIHDIWTYTAFATWRALRNSDIPYYVYTHGMLDPWFKRSYPIKHLKKWLYWPWANYRVLRDAKAVFFTTEKERILARQSFWLYKVTERVVGYGTSSPPDSPSRQLQAFLTNYPHLCGKRIILFISRIHPKKGVDLLISAFASIRSLDPSLRLVIAGPDSVGCQSTLLILAKQLGIDHLITWTGMLQGDLKWGAFRAAELFCLPSHQENFGIVVAESLSCALPVAIAQPVNICDEVSSAHAGIVFPDTVLGTTSALQSWLELSYHDKSTMSDNALRLFKSNYDYKKVAANLLPYLHVS